ncbi:MAG: glycine cleavage system protein H [Candidatus Cloacimonadota bacterium]|nr:MAG: glycine cleavage system protein H [Candidatus Cloacimonadota bacterium]
MMVPKNLYYTDSHEWVKVEGDEAFIGITEYAATELGDIVYVDLPQEGDNLTSGEPLGSIEAVKAVEDLISPISGEVLSVNGELEDTPDTINHSPFEDGWLVKVRLEDKDELANLMNAEDYQKMIDA